MERVQKYACNLLGRQVRLEAPAGAAASKPLPVAGKAAAAAKCKRCPTEAATHIASVLGNEAYLCPKCAEQFVATSAEKKRELWTWFCLPLDDVDDLDNADDDDEYPPFTLDDAEIVFQQIHADHAATVYADAARKGNKPIVWVITMRPGVGDKFEAKSEVLTADEFVKTAATPAEAAAERKEIDVAWSKGKALAVFCDGDGNVQFDVYEDRNPAPASPATASPAASSATKAPAGPKPPPSHAGAKAPAFAPAPSAGTKATPKPAAGAAVVTKPHPMQIRAAPPKAIAAMAPTK